MRSAEPFCGGDGFHHQPVGNRRGCRRLRLNVPMRITQQVGLFLDPDELDRSFACVSASNRSGHLVVTDRQVAEFKRCGPAGPRICFQGELALDENPFDRNRRVRGGTDLTGDFVTGLLQDGFAGDLGIGSRNRDGPLSGQVRRIDRGREAEHQESNDGQKSRGHGAQPIRASN